MITSELEPFAAPSQKEVVAGVYAGVYISETTKRYESAGQALDASPASRLAHEAAVAKATSVLEDAEAEDYKAMSSMDASVTTIETAGASTSATASPVAPTLRSAPHTRHGLRLPHPPHPHYDNGDAGHPPGRQRHGLNHHS